MASPPNRVRTPSRLRRPSHTSAASGAATPTSLKQSDLKKFANAAAGHEGVLSDESGAVVVKPCTKAEIDFYQSCREHHPDWAAFMPEFMGHVELGVPAKLPEGGLHLDEEAIAALSSSHRAAATSDPDFEPELTLKRTPTLELKDAKRTSYLSPTSAAQSVSDKGKKLNTELGIALENIATGFTKPNVCDIKLGRRTWDESTPPEKRARLEKVCNESTSTPLGFRICGMKVFVGDQHPHSSLLLSDAGSSIDVEGFLTRGKEFGRTIPSDKVQDEGLLAYLDPERRKPINAKARDLAHIFAGGLEQIRNVIANSESRMIGASVLFVYEGDAEAFDRGCEEATKQQAEQVVHRENEEEDSDDEGKGEVANIKLIDFAHARWAPGEGPDENVLFGLDNLIKMMRDLGRLKD